MNTVVAMVVSAILAGGSSVSVNVDLSKLPEAADRADIERWILEDADKALSAAGHHLVPKAAHEITVSVEWYGNDLNTKLAISLDHGTPRNVQCPACDEEDWLPDVATAIVSFANEIENLDKPVPANVEPNTDPEPEPDREPLSVEEPGSAKSDQPPVMSWVGGVGIVAGVAGIGLLGGGVSDLSRNTEKAKDDDNPRTGTEKTFTTRGTVLAIGGGLMFVGGVVAVVLDVRRQKKKRQASIRPATSPTFVGLQLQGKF
ncbi:MAG: hypothetical protein JKY37_00415 [Nannocystaceae bacterium]|nr:hypothetical protein [Nannocystaceae bacterium]